MQNDIFDSPQSAGFGSNVHEVASDGECRVLRIDDGSGEGFMTMYRVFDGVYLMYNDMHLRQCISEYQNTETVLCIDHCREGRIEHENSLGGRYYMEAGDLRIDRRIHHEGTVELPLSHYHGISIGFVQDTAQKAIEHELNGIKVDIEALSQKFCPDGNELLIRNNEQLGLIFSQLYHTPKNIRAQFFKVKIAELLLMLRSIDPGEHTFCHRYFPASQTDKVKQIHSFITQSLERTYTVEELSERFGMPSATLRNVFKAVYGAPIYRYIKSYKMKAAASMLISDSGITVAQTAQRLGYDNTSKFAAAFKDVMGTTPQSYRKSQEEL